MRRLFRKELSAATTEYLRRKQAAIDGGSPPRATWESARTTKPMRPVVEALRAMVGKRGRCMYCEDSRGTDIDHFWPLARFKERTFLWENLLWSCADCNRHKLVRFLLDAQGAPLLIDPTADDPWDFLFYDTATGNITARYDLRVDGVDPRGKETMDAIPALGNEAVVDGRLRTVRNLKKAVRAFLRHGEEDVARARLDLLESIQDNDAYGLVGWYFRRDGQDESPFTELRSLHPEVWGEIVAYIL